MEATTKKKEIPISRCVCTDLYPVLPSYGSDLDHPRRHL